MPVYDKSREEAIHNKTLMITFGDFENNESKALMIGKTVADALKQEFTINWDVSINTAVSNAKLRHKFFFVVVGNNCNIHEEPPLFIGYCIQIYIG